MCRCPSARWSWSRSPPPRSRSSWWGPGENAPVEPASVGRDELRVLRRGEEEQLVVDRRTGPHRESPLNGRATVGIGIVGADGTEDHVLSRRDRDGVVRKRYRWAGGHQRRR